MTEPLWPAIAILAFVTLQRLVELPIRAANTKRLLAEGGREVGARHYPLIVAVPCRLVGGVVVVCTRPADQPSVPRLFVLIEFGRIWVLRTLGPRWTTRIIIVPGENIVARGPYRFVDHPNYLVVIAEIAVLPLIFGLWQIAVIFSLLNAAVLTVRIRAESRALASLRG